MTLNIKWLNTPLKRKIPDCIIKQYLLIDACKERYLNHKHIENFKFREWERSHTNTSEQKASCIDFKVNLKPKSLIEKKKKGSYYETGFNSPWWYNSSKFVSN